MANITIKTGPLPNTKYTLTGHSVASRNTCFYIPETKVMLDCGMDFEYIPEHIFCSHLHSDHAKSLPLCIVQLGLLKSQKKVNIYVPTRMKEHVRNYIDAFYAMSKNNKTHNAHTKYNLIGVDDNTKIEVKIRNTKYLVETFKCFHTVPCIGYGFIEVRKRLKEEYKTLSQLELTTLRKSGTDIQEEFEVPEFCYLGDTTEEVFVQSPHILEKYKTIMVECTFLEDNMIDKAKHKKHMHITNLDPIIKNNPNISFILYHFSNRYEKAEIIEFFKQKNYSNVVVWT
jgi:ribonuclease Z